MLKKILGNIIIIIIMLSSLNNIYASDVVSPDVPDSDVYESNTETENNEGTTQGSSNEETINQNTNTDVKQNDNNTDNKNSNKNENNNGGSYNNTNNTGVKNNSSTVTTYTTPVTNNTKSSEAGLSNLEVDVEGMTPDFNKDIVEYYLVVDLSVENIEVTALPVDSKANVTISGNENLVEGENTITIRVKAEDGTIKEYSIYVTKSENLEKADATLKSLQVNGYNLSPEFKTNIFNYNLNIQDSITNIEITAEATRENAKVEIEGNDDLQEGENLIKITVTAEDGITVRTYKINTYIFSEDIEIEEESKTPAIILLIVLGICIVGLGTYVFIKNKKK